MVHNGSSHHRHAPQPAPRDGRRRLLLIAVGVLVAIAAVLVVSLWDRSGDAVADRAAATRSASSTPSSPPATTSTPTPTPTPAETAATPDVPAAFADAMEQIGIPLDPHTGWVLADGICVRLAQPEYDEYRMAEGIERLFPSVPDEQAHDFVAMVAESVCGL
jgi:hypothetical protein